MCKMVATWAGRPLYGDVPRLVEFSGAEKVSGKVTLGHFHYIRVCFIEAAARFASL